MAKHYFGKNIFYCLGYVNLTQLSVSHRNALWQFVSILRDSIEVCVCLSFRELFSPSQKYQLLVYHADAIFHDKEYRNAACKYNMALQQKKVLSKTSKVRPSSTGGTTSAVQAQVSATKPSSAPLHTFTMLHIH